MSSRRRWRLNSYDVPELKNKPAQPFFSFTPPLYFQVPDQACVPFTVASSLAVLVNSQEQGVLLCDLLWLHWQPSQPSFFSLYRLALLVNPRDKLIKTTWVVFHSIMAGIAVKKMSWCCSVFPAKVAENFVISSHVDGSHEPVHISHRFCFHSAV